MIETAADKRRPDDLIDQEGRERDIADEHGADDDGNGEPGCKPHRGVPVPLGTGLRPLRVALIARLDQLPQRRGADEYDDERTHAAHGNGHR